MEDIHLLPSDFCRQHHVANLSMLASSYVCPGGVERYEAIGGILFVKLIIF